MSEIGAVCSRGIAIEKQQQQRQIPLPSLLSSFSLLARIGSSISSQHHAKRSKEPMQGFYIRNYCYDLGKHRLRQYPGPLGHFAEMTAQVLGLGLTACLLAHRQTGSDVDRTIAQMIFAST